MTDILTCGSCERRPKTSSGRCYYDTLKRHHVKKSSNACGNFKKKDICLEEVKP